MASMADLGKLEEVIKGVYLKKVSVSSTMGVGVRVDQSSLQA